MALLSLLAIMRITEARRGGWEYLKDRYNITGTPEPKPIHVLFGRKLYEIKFP